MKIFTRLIYATKLITGGWVMILSCDLVKVGLYCVMVSSWIILLVIDLCSFVSFLNSSVYLSVYLPEICATSALLSTCAVYVLHLTFADYVCLAKHDVFGYLKNSVHGNDASTYGGLYLPHVTF